MGKAQSKHEECESEELQKAKRLIEEKGIVGAEAFIREKLEGWKDVKIKFGVTGNSGVGKSSFINAFRGIDDEDGGAAEIDVVEATSAPACFFYPDNPNITLTDLPGIGTPTYPNLEVYCEKFDLEGYDTFLILTATRFTQLDLELAQIIKSMGKSFFLIRTKIDQDEDNEKRKKSPDIKKMLSKIRTDCFRNVKDLGIREDEIFLISKHHTNKWDFECLVQAILEKLSTHQKEALILSLSLKNVSKDIVKRKVEVLRRQLRMASIVFRAAKLLLGLYEFHPTSTTSKDSISYTALLAMAAVGFKISERIAFVLLGQTTAKFYRSQLGLPEEDSDEFKKMKPEIQERMRKCYPKKENGFWEQCLSIDTPESMSKDPLPLLETLGNSLNRLLDEMQQLSLDILDEAAHSET